jgi:hypothetical protein
VDRSGAEALEPLGRGTPDSRTLTELRSDPRTSSPARHGIEVCGDRPRDSWRRSGRELVMGTDPVDVDAVVRAGEGEPWRGMPSGTKVGHVHLHVGDIERARDYYGDALGFDKTVWSYPGALFLGAGGYHHHVGVNTWAGPGATAAPRQLECRGCSGPTASLASPAAPAARRAPPGTGSPAPCRPDAVAAVSRC